MSSFGEDWANTELEASYVLKGKDLPEQVQNELQELNGKLTKKAIDSTRNEPLPDGLSEVKPVIHDGKVVAIDFIATTGKTLSCDGHNNWECTIKPPVK